MDKPGKLCLCKGLEIHVTLFILFVISFSKASKNYCVNKYSRGYIWLFEPCFEKINICSIFISQCTVKARMIAKRGLHFRASTNHRPSCIHTPQTPVLFLIISVSRRKNDYKFEKMEKSLGFPIVRLPLVQQL